MRTFTRRTHTTRPHRPRRLGTALARLAAGLCVCAAFAFVPAGAFARQAGAGGGADSPLRVYVTWLDRERTAAVIAFRGRDEKRRVVVGVAKPFEPGSHLPPGHLYLIQGFRENVPEEDLEELRQRLKGFYPPAGAQPKFELVTQPLEGSPDISFGEIDEDFLKYVHAAGERTSDFEVWDVTAPTSGNRSNQTINVVFVGGLVLMKSRAAVGVRGRAEAAIVDLLSRLAREENTQRKSATLGADCGGAGLLLALQANPSKYEDRKGLRDAAAGGLSGPPNSEGEYPVVNNGWNKRSLRLNVEPADARASVTPTTTSGDELPDTGLELHPCVPKTVRVEPRGWYKEFRGRVSFTREGETLTARVPPLSVPTWLLVAGSVPGLLLIGFGLRSLIRHRRRGRAAQSGRRGEHRPTIFNEGAPAGSVWKRLFNFPFRSEEPKSTEVETDTALPTQPAAEGLQDLLRRRSAAYEEVRRFDGQLDAFLKQTLQDAQSSAGARQELMSVQAERDGWVNTLKPLGETPDEALRKWEKADERRAYIEGKVFEINSRLNGAADAKAGDDGRGADATSDDAIGLALANLSEAVPALRCEVEDFRGMSRRILLALDPPSGPLVAQGPLDPAHLAEEVEGLRRLLEEVLQKYAGPLRLGSDDADLGAQPVASLRERFGRWARRHEALGLLESDERVRRARAVSGELAHVGRVLRDGGRPEYDALLAGSDIEPAALARDLLKASESLDAKLSSSLSKLAGAACEKSDWLERFDANDIDEVLLPFTRHLLLEAPAAPALLRMLRLWQVMRAYCAGSPDAVASEFYAQGQDYLRGCEQVIEDLARLGVRLHPVRFFERPGGGSDDPVGGGWKCIEVSSTPSVQNSPQLYAPIREKLRLNFEECGQTVADVDAWGFDCDLAPDLSRPTRLWRWGWDARGSAET